MCRSLGHGALHHGHSQPVNTGPGHSVDDNGPVVPERERGVVQDAVTSSTEEQQANPDDLSFRFWQLVKASNAAHGGLCERDIDLWLQFLRSLSLRDQSLGYSSVAQFKVYDEQLQKRRRVDFWNSAVVGGDLQIEFRFRDGLEAIVSLLMDASN